MQGIRERIVRHVRTLQVDEEILQHLQGKCKWDFFLIFFYVAFFVMCGTMGYLFHVWGDVSVGFFFSCDKYLYCLFFFVLFWEGIGITCS